MRTRIAESLARQGLMQTLGVKLLEVGEGTVTLELPISSAVSQQNGFVHAGAIASVLDSACGFAALSVMPQNCDVLAVEFKINFVAPAVGVVVRAEKIATLELRPMVLRVQLRDGEVYALNLREVKGKMRKQRFREQVRQFAAQHHLQLLDNSPAAAPGKRDFTSVTTELELIRFEQILGCSRVTPVWGEMHFVTLEFQQ